VTPCNDTSVRDTGVVSPSIVARHDASVADFIDCGAYLTGAEGMFLDLRTVGTGDRGRARAHHARMVRFMTAAAAYGVADRR
jgi:hypothetical protein